VNTNRWRSQGVGGRGSDTIFFHKVFGRILYRVQQINWLQLLYLIPNLCDITKTLALKKKNITFIYKVLRRMVQTQLGLINPM
jgi:hypothetical protein